MYGRAISGIIIIDRGLQPDHQSLNVAKQWYVGDKTSPSEKSLEELAHATNMAGVAAGRHSSLGPPGIAPNTLIYSMAMTDLEPAEIAEAMRGAAVMANTYHVSVVVMSIGTTNAAANLIANDVFYRFDKTLQKAWLANLTCTKVSELIDSNNYNMSDARQRRTWRHFVDASESTFYFGHCLLYDNQVLFVTAAGNH